MDTSQAVSLTKKQPADEFIDILKAGLRLSTMTGPERILERIKQSRLTSDAVSKAFDDATCRTFKSLLASDELRT